MKMKRKAVALETEKKEAFFELWIALIFLMAFTVVDIAVFLLQPLYTFITAFYGHLLTTSLIHFSFLLMTVLLWLVYRRWKGADQICSELEGIIASISSHVLLVVGSNQIIQRCSQSIERMFGYKIAEAVDQKITFLYEEQPTISGRLSQTHNLLEQKGFHVGEASGKKKNGDAVRLEVITGRLANSPNTLVLLRDVSERRRLEEELLQHQKLEALGRLAGGIAHDYNNFMTVISGFAKLMKRRMSASEPLRAELEELLKTSDRAIALTRQLLAFGRRQVVNPKVANFNEVILDMDKLLRQLIGEDIELVMDLTKNLKPIKADVIQLEQIVLNLAMNARNAMAARGGRIVIETHNIDHIQLDYRQESARPSAASGDYVLLVVKDKGVGMSEEAKKHLFEPFFTTGQEKGGVGLGLATCYGIVRQNLGQIFVSSEPGEGTTVRVYFPSVPGSPEKISEPEESEVLPRGEETILVAENEPSVRAFASQVLREQGYEVIEAADGLEALNLVQEKKGKKIQLLLTDLVMPRMRGEELAQRLKDLRPEIKVLFTSGYVDRIQDEVWQGHQFLQKPFSPYALTVKVREVLNQ